MKRLKIIIAVVAVIMPQIVAGQNQITKPGKKKITEQTSGSNTSKVKSTKQRNSSTMSAAERDAVIQNHIIVSTQSKCAFQSIEKSYHRLVHDAPGGRLLHFCTLEVI